MPPTDRLRLLTPYEGRRVCIPEDTAEIFTFQETEASEVVVKPRTRAMDAPLIAHSLLTEDFACGRAFF